jgi:septum site-determining protein MinD
MSEQLPSDARVFAVASGKGGVGKTTTAVNVGAALAESGAETVVVDADLGMANVADLLDLSISQTLQDVLAGDMAVEKATYRTHAGMAVVPGATDLSSYGEVDPARLREVVAALRAEFEYVFLDAGAGVSHDAALPLGLADAVVLVTTPRETAARDAAKTRELAERIDATVAGVVVTRVREERSELGPDVVAERVGAPVLSAIPEDGAVREALSAGRPIVTHAPGSLVTAASRQLAASLTGREVAEPTAESTRSTDADDPTSLAELLEREADRSTDVSALTGDPTPESGDSASNTEEDSTPDADSTPTLDLDGESAEESEDDGEPLDDSIEDVKPSADKGDSDAGARTGDGDVVIAEEAPDASGEVADGDRDATDEASTDVSSDETDAPGDDPMAEIPRFEEESAEEFTRGNEAADALATDPLEAGPVDEAVATGDGEFAADEVDAGEGTDADATPGDGNEAVDGDEAGGDEARDEAAAGPHVEIDEDPDASGRTGLLGRLAGLFR